MNAYLFRPGVVVAKPAALEAFEEAKEDPSALLRRYLTGDWGDLDEFDKLQSESALENDYRILSAYHLKNGTRIWIITEADRSSTCSYRPTTESLFGLSPGLAHESAGLRRLESRSQSVGRQIPNLISDPELSCSHHVAAT